MSVSVHGMRIDTPLADKVGDDPKLPEYLRAVIANYGHLNFAVPSKTQQGVVMQPLAWRLLAEWTEPRYATVSPALIRELVARCNVQLFSRVFCTHFMLSFRPLCASILLTRRIQPPL